MFCRKCDSETDVKDGKCVKCGTKLSGSSGGKIGL